MSYLLAHKMSDRKWLIRYSFFWLSICLAVNYKLISTPDIQNVSHLPTYKVVAFFILLNCTTAITGVITKTIVLHFNLENKEIYSAIVNLLGFFSIPFVGSALIESSVIFIRLLIALYHLLSS